MVWMEVLVRKSLTLHSTVTHSMKRSGEWPVAQHSMVVSSRPAALGSDWRCASNDEPAALDTA